MLQKETSNDIGTFSLPPKVVVSGKMALPSTSKWNIADLGMRLGADVVSAATASIIVAPVITLIDRYATAPTVRHMS